MTFRYWLLEHINYNYTKKKLNLAQNLYVFIWIENDEPETLFKSFPYSFCSPVLFEMGENDKKSIYPDQHH